MCDRYEAIYHAHLKIHLLPKYTSSFMSAKTLHYRFLLFPLSSTLGDTLKNPMNWNIIEYYITKQSSLRWQTLVVISLHCKNPVLDIVEQVTTWTNRVKEETPHCKIYSLSEMKKLMRTDCEEMENEEEEREVIPKESTIIEDEDESEEEE